VPNVRATFAADLGRLGSLMMWVDAATGGTWSASVLGTQRTGFITVTAQAAALRLPVPSSREGCAGSASWSRQGLVLVRVLAAHHRSGPASVAVEHRRLQFRLKRLHPLTGAGPVHRQRMRGSGD
jgi:hypothetical protein